MYAILTILAGVLWGCISIFIKTLADLGLSSIHVMFIRATLSSVMLFFFLLIKDRSLLKIKLRDIWMFFGTGVVSLTFFSLCYFTTILEVGASVAVILLYTSPIFVLILSVILFQEKINLIKIVALVLTFTGCILVTGVIGNGNVVTIKGFLIGLCAGFGYALYSIFSRFALKKYNSLTVTFYTFVFSGVSLIPFTMGSDLLVKMLPNGNFWLFSVGIALFCTVLPYIFYTLGLSGLETGRAAILVTVEPLVGTLIGFIIYNESVSILKIIGIVCIFIAVILLGIKTESKSKKLKFLL